VSRTRDKVRQLWQEANDVASPTWPPLWLPAAGIVLAILVVGTVIVPVVSAIADAVDSGHGKLPVGGQLRPH
jgi:hypothetical protein